MKKLNPKGLSLMELTAAMPLYVLISLVLGLAMTQFITAYYETKDLVILQEDLFRAVETMRYGYAVEPVTDDEALIGLFTADSISIGFPNNSIMIRPRNTNPGTTFYSRFFLDSHSGELRASGQYGLQSYVQKRIFPTNPSQLEGDNRFMITDLSFTNETPAYGGATKLRLVGIHIEAQVRFRPKQDGQSRTDDIEKNTRTISYNTRVYLGNSGGE